MRGIVYILDKVKFTISHQMCSTHTPRQKFQTSSLTLTSPSKNSPKSPKWVRHRVRQNPHFKPKITPPLYPKFTQNHQNHHSNTQQIPINSHLFRTQSLPYYNRFKNHIKNLHIYSYLILKIPIYKAIFTSFHPIATPFMSNRLPNFHIQTYNFISYIYV